MKKVVLSISDRKVFSYSVKIERGFLMGDGEEEENKETAILKALQFVLKKEKADIFITLSEVYGDKIEICLRDIDAITPMRKRLTGYGQGEHYEYGKTLIEVNYDSRGKEHFGGVFTNEDVKSLFARIGKEFQKIGIKIKYDK